MRCNHRIIEKVVKPLIAEINELLTIHGLNIRVVYGPASIKRVVLRVQGEERNEENNCGLINRKRRNDDCDRGGPEQLELPWNVSLFVLQEFMKKKGAERNG